MSSLDIGDHATATDAYGTEHQVTVTKPPWRGPTMAVIGLRFDNLPAHQHTTIVWPLSAVRPVPSPQLAAEIGADQDE